jgi:hypothetical protein
MGQELYPPIDIIPNPKQARSPRLFSFPAVTLYTLHFTPKKQVLNQKIAFFSKTLAYVHFLLYLCALKVQIICSYSSQWMF